MRILSYAASLVAECTISLSSLSSKATHAIPYSSQYARLNFSQDYINSSTLRQRDKKWPITGASSSKEYALWSNNVCGIACFIMILDFYKIKHPPIITMAKTCASYGGYQITRSTIEGLYYYPFTAYTKREFAITCKVAPILSLKRLLYETAQGRIVIASVSPEIKFEKKKTKPEGGHLVVVTGYNNKNNTISIHNPSGLYRKSQKNHTMPYELFSTFFARRGLIFDI